MAESAYFTALHVTNVRCFRDQTLDLTVDSGRRPARWTLILGENGVGKTTLLQCLAWTQPWKVRGKSVDPVLFEVENPLLERLLPANRVEALRLSATLSVGSQLFLADDTDEQTGAPGNSATTHLSITFGADRKLQDRKSRATGQSEVDCFVVAYGANRQRGLRNLDKLELEDPIGTRLSDVTELYDVEQMLQDLHYGSETESDPIRKEDLRRLKSVLARILPDQVALDAIDINAPDPLERGGRSGVYLETFSGGIPWAELSLGYRTTLAWAADLAWRLLKRYRDSDDPLSEPVVVLIDEIDLHLHPRWQRGILDDLSTLFAGAQFVATTHSPLMAQTGEDANFALLKKRPGGDDVEIFNEPDVVRGWRVDQFLTSELFGGLSGRSPQIERLLSRRDELVAKRSRDANEEAELASLRLQISELPTAEFPEDQRAMDSIREAAALLKKRGGGLE